MTFNAIVGMIILLLYLYMCDSVIEFEILLQFVSELFSMLREALFLCLAQQQGFF